MSILGRTAKRFYSSAGSILSSGSDLILKLLRSTGNFIVQLADYLGNTAFLIKDSLGNILAGFYSNNIIKLGDTAKNTVLIIRNALGVAIAKIHGEEGITNYGGLVEPATIVNSATYILLPTDKSLNVKYVGDVTITIPASLYIEGQTFSVLDGRKQASAYPIYIKDETPTELYKIEGDGDNWDFKFSDNVLEVI